MDGLLVTKEAIESYLASCEAKGLSRNTLTTYRSKLLQFYALLPKDKTVKIGTIGEIANSMRRNGYSISAINLLLSSTDGFVHWCGRRDLQSCGRMENEESIQPEITRTEYQRLLSAAKRADRERDYLMIKTIVLTGVNLQELTALSVQNVERGWVNVNRGEMRRIPFALKTELQSYAQRSGIGSGPLFCTREDEPISRVSVTNAIKSLAKSARVEEEKCNPRCLRKLYQTTQAHFAEMMQMLIEQAQERLLETEQRATGWDDSTKAGSIYSLGLYDQQVMKD